MLSLVESADSFVAQTTGRAERLAHGINEIAVASGVDVRVVQIGGLFRIHFRSDRTERAFVEAMSVRHVIAPTGAPWLVAPAHDYFDIEATIDAAAAAMAIAAIPI